MTTDQIILKSIPWIIGLILTCLTLRASAELAPDAAVLRAESRRIAAIARASSAVVAVFDSAGQGGGSGVVISPDGFALTNFHVVAPCGPAMKCGMSDGRLYDAVVVGIDPTGDVALVQLLGRKDFPLAGLFPHANLGNSDQVRAGDWAFTVGNPFLLADDFKPSVAYGMISGVHRYQYPAGTLLEYTDCLQTDAAINPGNSGGPLFNASGKLIGINGRGSFEKRGRVNVGVGYAISINQIKRFLAHLKSGRIVDHATLGATASTDDQGRIVVDDILERSDAFRRGLRYGDQIVRFAGREITTTNALKNVLGVYPRGWPVPLTFRREGKTYQAQVRLMGLHDQSALFDMVQKEARKPVESPEIQPPGEEKPKRKSRMPKIGRGKPKLPVAVAERYEARRGYANYWYNAQQQQRILNAYRKQCSLAKTGYAWHIAGSLPDGKSLALDLGPDRGEARFPWGKSGALFRGDMAGDGLETQLSPPRSGGLLLALHLWQRLLDKGLKRFGEVYYLGQMPYGPEGQLADCLIGIHMGIEIRFLFDPKSVDLVAIEMYSSDETDLCEIGFSNFQTISGRRLPRNWVVRYGDDEFARWQVDHWQFGGLSDE